MFQSPNSPYVCEAQYYFPAAWSNEVGTLVHGLRGRDCQWEIDACRGSEAICINPEVRVLKENRTAGVLDNHAEGQRYAEHGLRKLVRNRTPEIMPAINNFFSDPK